MRPLYDCALFQGLPEAELHAALRFFAAQERACPRGALLKAAPAPLHAFGLVLDGRVRVSMTDIDGREMLLSQVGIMLGRMYADFDSRNYGYSRLHKLIDGTGRFETRYELLDSGGRNLMIKNK